MQKKTELDPRYVSESTFISFAIPFFLGTAGSFLTFIALIVSDASQSSDTIVHAGIEYLILTFVAYPLLYYAITALIWHHSMGLKWFTIASIVVTLFFFLIIGGALLLMASISGCPSC